MRTDRMKFLIILIAICFKLCSCKIYCVVSSNSISLKTTETASESDENCYPLSYYTKNVERFFATHVTIKFHPGVHSLESNEAIEIDNVTNFALEGDGNRESTPVIIKCKSSNKTGFYFSRASHIRLENLTLSGCGVVIGHNTRAALAFDTVLSLHISFVTVSDSLGYGVHAIQVTGNVTISNSIFAHNRGNHEYNGGNARFKYSKSINSMRTLLIISNSRFMHGYDVKKHSFNISKPYYFPTATGLDLQIHCPGVNVTMSNITAWSNSADNGGNLAINITDHAIGSVVLRDSTICQGKGHRGGGLRVWSVPHSGNTTMNVTVLEVINTHFIENHAHSAGGALYISHYEHETNFLVHNLIFTRCMFSRNSVPASGKGAVTEIVKHKKISHRPYLTPQFSVTFAECNFTNNWIILDNTGIIHGAIMDLFSVTMINFQDCLFIGNNSTVISTVGSNVIFTGELSFENNTAINGGAIRFCDTSIMFISNNTHVLFKGNKAELFGGAIYAQQRCLETATPCFFQPVVTDRNVTELKGSMQLVFADNKAGKAGDAVYGGSIDVCYSFIQFFYKTHNTSYFLSRLIFDNIFNFTKRNDSADISSDPYGVCLCSSNEKNCGAKELNITDYVYPGKQFSIVAVPIGQRQGIAPAVITATLLEPNNHTQLNAAKNNRATLASECKELKYSIQSLETNSKVRFKLTAQTTTFNEDSFYYKFHPPTITVHLKPCPWGFALNATDQPSCSCDNLLLGDNFITCDSKHQKIRRRGTIWLGSKHTNETLYSNHTLYFSNKCPYCKYHAVSVKTNNVDEQCKHSRTGVLCGACVSSLSVILGGTECYRCTNMTSLLLTPLFALMGIVLVLLLILLNLTVTEGTINGAIFYANIMQISKEVYFPYQDSARPVLFEIPLTVISWLNLDFGIHMCFYRGMDAFAKAALQYVFPVYIWLVVVVIILMSRRFAIAQRLIGGNSVKILATLFLLSAAKVGRAVIMSLAWTTIRSSRGDFINVWLADGNILYLHGKHIFLFLLGIIFFILVVLYTLLVATIQCTQRAPHRSLFIWIHRLKPFLDAYTGPYKTPYRFWTGFLLLIRIAIYTLLSLTVINDHITKLSIIAMSCTLVLFLQAAFHGVYSRRNLDAIEASFVFNLGGLSILSCVIQYRNIPTSHWTHFISLFSVYVAVLEILAILIYRCYASFKGSAAHRVCRNIFPRFSQAATHRTSRPPLDFSNRRYGSVNAKRRLPCISQTEVVLSSDESSPDSYEELLNVPPYDNISTP